MTFGSVFGRVLSPTFKPSSQAAAGGTWWDLNGTITSCIAAYQPKGAASYAASLTDLSGNSNDAYEGTTPSWNTATGWTSSNDAYLKTGISPDDGYSAIVRFTGTGSSICYPFGGRKTNNLLDQFLIVAYGSSGERSYRFGTMNQIFPGGQSSGIMAMAGANCYLNGEADGTTAGTMQTPSECYLLGFQSAGSAVLSYCTIAAFALYNAELTSTQIGNITTAMAAL